VRQACNRCQAPRAQSQHVPVRVPPVRVPPRTEIVGLVARRGPGGAPVAGVDGNWSCAHCHNVNFAHREVCNRCGAHRPQSFPKGGGKGVAPVAGVDGNWQCRYCNNVNYAVRAECNRCGAPREEDQAPPPQHRPLIHVGGGCGRGVALGAMPHQNGGSKGSKGPPVAGIGGNWKCQFCGNVNFAVRDACNRCAASKVDAEAPVIAKGKGGKGPPVAGENGNWGCLQCGNVNYASRDACNRCGAPRPEDAEDAGPEAKRARRSEEEEEVAWLAASETFQQAEVAASYS